jgi:diguanylate cyclase (GGDEF)-like protein
MRMNNGRFLILDRDNPGQSLLAAELHQLGCDVTESAAQSLFIEAIKTRQCDIALIHSEGDAIGNSVDSVEWLNFIRQRASSPVIIVAVQKVSHMPDQAQIEALGYDELLHHPRHPGQLAAQVRSLGRLALMRRELVRRQETLQAFVSLIEDSDIDLEFDDDTLFRPMVQPKLLLLDFNADQRGATMVSGRNRLPYQCFYADSCDKAHELLFSEQIDITLINAACESEDPLGFVAGLRHSSSLYNHPVLVMADANSRIDTARIFKAGAQDFVRGEIGIDELEIRLQALLRHEKLRQTLALDCETSRESMVRDGLTGLYSYGFGMAHLGRLNEQLCTISRPVAVALCRIDNIKQVNSSFGFVAGDAVIREAGAIIRRCLRGEDLAVRYSGASYLLIFPETSADNASIAMSRLDSLLRHTMYELPGLEDHIRANVSYKLVDWKAPATLDQLMRSLYMPWPQAA